MTERDLTPQGREAAARAIAQGYLDKAGGDLAGVQKGFNTQDPDREKYLAKMAKRFAQAMAARLVDIDSLLTEEDLAFMFLELFKSLDVMKPFEMIAAFKRVGDWCGFSSIPVRALKLPQGRFPVLKFSKVGS